MLIKKIAQSSGVVATVVDGFASTSATNALSANQGKVLNDRTVDNGWNNLTLAGTWAAYDINNYETAQYKKIGNIVYIRGMVKDGGSPTLGVLPTGYRPAKYTYIDHFPVGVPKSGRIDPDGTINLYDYSATFDALGIMMFFTD